MRVHVKNRILLQVNRVRQHNHVFFLELTRAASSAEVNAFLFESTAFRDERDLLHRL